MANCASDARGSGELILLADDEASVRHTAARVLEFGGYRVLVAAGGHEALELFDRNRDAIALLVTDVTMPRMGGPQLVALIRASGSRVPVLFMSGHSGPDEVETARFDPADAYITKPWSIAELLSKVRGALDDAPTEAVAATAG